MNREQAENLLAQLIFDELEEPTRSELLAYLQTDVELDEQLGTMRAAAGLLGEAVAAEGAPRLDPIRRQHLHQQTQQRAWRHRVLSIAGAQPLRRVAMLAACLALATALVSLFLPALGAARRTARQVQVSTQLRGIHQGMVMYAERHDGRYPESLGQLLEENYFTPDYLISPYDDTQVPRDFDSYTLEQKKQWADKHSSFKMLNLGDKPTLDSSKVVGYAQIPGGKGASIVYDDNSTTLADAREARQVLGPQLHGLVIEEMVVPGPQSSIQIARPIRRTPQSGAPLAAAVPSESRELLQDERRKITEARERLAMRGEREPASGPDSGQPIVTDGNATSDDVWLGSKTTATPTEWNLALNSRGIVLTDRNSGDSGKATEANTVSQLKPIPDSAGFDVNITVPREEPAPATPWSESTRGDWRGTITRNDSSTSFETHEQRADTRVQSGQAGDDSYSQRNLFHGADGSGPAGEPHDHPANGPVTDGSQRSSGSGASPSFADAPSFDLNDALSNDDKASGVAPNDSMFKQARGLYAQQEAAEGAKALAEGDHKAAIRHYERALQLDPDNTEVQAKLDATLAASNAALAERSGLETERGNTALLREAARVEYEQAMNAARAKLAERDFVAATDFVEKARTVADRNQRLFTAETYRSTRAQADSLSTQIIDTRRATEAIAQAETEARSRAVAQQEAEAARERQQREVQSLLQQARVLQRGMEYDRALELLDQAMFIDPTNIVAQAMKDMVEDSKTLVDTRDAKRHLALEEAQFALEDKKATIPYSDLLVYPLDWPQITTTRLAGLDPTISDAEANHQAAQRLKEPVPVHFEGNRLDHVIDYLRNTTGTNVSVNWQAIEAVGVEKDAPVTLQVTKVPADQALKLVLQQVDQAAEFEPLGYTIIEGVVTIDTLSNLKKQAEAAAEVAKPQPEPEPEKPQARKPRLMPVNPWVMTADDQLSTFALDVDTASYGITRRYIHDGFLPPKHTVRMEEFVNSFDYQYPTGKNDSDVFAVHAEAGPAPFAKDAVLVKVGVRGKVVGRDQAKPAHLVFVIDTSGSMDRPDRLPLLKQGLAMLLDQLAEQDRVSIISYGTEARLLIENASVSSKTQIMAVLDDLQTGGSTNLLAGVAVGYDLAKRHVVPDGVNRIILCSDGVANVGPSEAEDLLKQIAQFRGQGVTFTSVGVGSGNYDDELLEQLSNKGDGSYLFLGSIEDAQHAFVEDLSATRPTIAYDAKIQVEFNPQRVRRYRLIGYENRDIADADFRNDAVDAGEVGSGQSATALYEVELLGPVTGPGASDLPDLGTVFVRYRDAENGRVNEHATRLTGRMIASRTPSDDPRFYLAACAAELAEVLRGSEHVDSQDINRNLDAIQRVLTDAVAQLPLDAEAHDLLDLVRRAHGLPRAE